MKRQTLSRSLRLILRRLKKYQLENGSWAENNFINALITYSLAEMGAPKAMLEKSIDFIVRQKKAGWMWNYYPLKQNGNTDASYSASYPDDFDDTFCSLIVILKLKPELIDKAVLIQISNLLKNNECAENGPYFTWLEKKWNDVDVIVNANVAHFMSLTGMETKKLTNYVDRCLEKQSLKSKYYHNPFLAHYLIARNYKGKKCSFLIEQIGGNLKKKAAGRMTISPANAAMAVSALVRLGEHPKKIKFLIERVTASLLVKNETLNEPFYVERIANGKTWYAESEALTLALCGEAIRLYARTLKKYQNKKIGKRNKNSEKNKSIS